MAQQRIAKLEAEIDGEDKSSLKSKAAEEAKMVMQLKETQEQMKAISE